MEPASVVVQTLSDRSRAFNVNMQLADGTRARFDCEDSNHAYELAALLNKCTDSSVQP